MWIQIFPVLQFDLDILLNFCDSYFLLNFQGGCGSLIHGTHGINAKIHVGCLRLVL